MFKVAPISTRRQLRDVLNDRGLVGDAVEIGTHRGEFAKMLLNGWKGRILYCVDPWENLPGYEDQAKLLWGDAPTRAYDLEETYLQLKEHVGRFTMLQMTSEKASEQFGGMSLDFAYIDGDHRFEHVHADLERWWEKLKPGGILAGHDWVQPGETHCWAGEVQDALRTFLEQFTWPPDVMLVVEENGLPWSYYMEKPK